MADPWGMRVYAISIDDYTSDLQDLLSSYGMLQLFNLDSRGLYYYAKMSDIDAIVNALIANDPSFYDEWMEIQAMNNISGGTLLLSTQWVNVG